MNNVFKRFYYGLKRGINMITVLVRCDERVKQLDYEKARAILLSLIKRSTILASLFQENNKH